jgi:hypothetical protein
MNYLWLASLAALAYFVYELKPNDNGFSYRRLVGAYVIWAFVNLILFLMAEGDGEDFWPFDGFRRISDYDISELAVYVLGPVVYNYARNLMRKSS